MIRLVDEAVIELWKRGTELLATEANPKVSLADFGIPCLSLVFSMDEGEVKGQFVFEYSAISEGQWYVKGNHCPWNLKGEPWNSFYVELDLKSYRDLRSAIWEGYEMEIGVIYSLSKEGYQEMISHPDWKDDYEY